MQDDRLRTFRLTLGYDGTNYAGWQVQIGQPTIQGLLERAIAQLVGVRVPITGSGRTDSGVHALAQVASLTTDRWRDSADALGRAMTTKLPLDISIYRVEEMPAGFHALRDATGKRYRYCLQAGGIRDAFEHRYRWHFYQPLDTGLMQNATQYILGTHDFACFQAAGSDRKTTIRTVRDICLAGEQRMHGGIKFHIEIEADGFLYNMVRNIVGSLVEVGRKRRGPEWIGELIAAGDRNLAGPTAPPQGLFLINVMYDIEPL